MTGTDVSGGGIVDEQTAQRTGQRPIVVTVAVAIWWVVLAVRILSVVVRVVQQDAEDPGMLPAALVGGVLGVALSVFLAWVALRMGRGSDTARIWLAVLAALAVVSGVVSVATGTLTWGVLDPAALGVAAVLSYLPSARPWFPRFERRPRQAEPRTIGWDPQTGERITEQHGVDGRG